MTITEVNNLLDLADKVHGQAKDLDAHVGSTIRAYCRVIGTLPNKDSRAFLEMVVQAEAMHLEASMLVREARRGLEAHQSARAAA